MYLWPECVPIWNHWQELQTQWRVGMNGATGLCYSGVCAYLLEAESDPATRRETFAAIRAAEREVLRVSAEKSATRSAQSAR